MTSDYLLIVLYSSFSFIWLSIVATRQEKRTASNMKRGCYCIKHRSTISYAFVTRHTHDDDDGAITSTKLLRYDGLQHYWSAVVGCKGRRAKGPFNFLYIYHGRNMVIVRWQGPMSVQDFCNFCNSTPLLRTFSIYTHVFIPAGALLLLLLLFLFFYYFIAPASTKPQAKN